MYFQFTILIVDDDDDLRDLISVHFAADLRFRILTATNGREAAKIIAGEPVDLVITDLQMPQMNGSDLLLQIRMLERRPKAMLMSAADLRELRMEDIGVSSFFKKPLKVSALHRAACRLLRCPERVLLETFESAGQTLRVCESERAESVGRRR